MDKGYRHTSLAYATRNTLDRIVSHIAYTKETWQIRLKQVRRAIWRRRRWIGDVISGADVAVLSLKPRRQPISNSVCANHHK
jgi:hypothetical protein